MKKDTTGYKKLVSDIEEHGLHIIHVLESENKPSFTYSVGQYHNYQHPEIIMIGLKHELAHILINNIGFDVKQGQSYESGMFYKNILDNYECLMTDVKKNYYDEYVGQAIRFYKNDDFPLLQCIYPTIKGAYPWEGEWPEEIKYLQPMLGEVNKE